MIELVEYLVKQFVDSDNFEIEKLEDTDKVQYKVFVDKDHIAKVIGKGGRNSKAIRTIVRAASLKMDKIHTVCIQEK